MPICHQKKQFNWDSSYKYFATLSGKAFQLDPFFQIFPNPFCKSGSIRTHLSNISQPFKSFWTRSSNRTLLSNVRLPHWHGEPLPYNVATPLPRLVVWKECEVKTQQGLSNEKTHANYNVNSVNNIAIERRQCTWVLCRNYLKNTTVNIQGIQMFCQKIKKLILFINVELRPETPNIKLLFIDAVKINQNIIINTPVAKT